MLEVTINPIDVQVANADEEEPQFVLLAVVDGVAIPYDGQMAGVPSAVYKIPLSKEVAETIGKVADKVKPAPKFDVATSMSEADAIARITGDLRR